MIRDNVDKHYELCQNDVSAAVQLILSLTKLGSNGSFCASLNQPLLESSISGSSTLVLNHGKLEPLSDFGEVDVFSDLDKYACNLLPIPSMFRLADDVYDPTIQHCVNGSIAKCDDVK